MKKMLLLISLLQGTILTAHAQSQPVRIEVTKNTSKDMKTTGRSEYYTKKQGTENVLYTIVVVNQSSGVLSNVVVQWAILLRPVFRSTYIHNTSSDSSLRAVSGTRNINLGLGQHEKFDTEPIDLTVTKYNTGYGYHSRDGDQIEGYVIKVMQDGKVLAVECQPKDAMERLDNIKSNPGKR